MKRCCDGCWNFIDDGTEFTTITEEIWSENRVKESKVIDLCPDCVHRCERALKAWQPEAHR